MDEGTARIALPRKNGEVWWTSIDDADLPLVGSYPWRALRNRWKTYAVTPVRDMEGRKQYVMMHRVILAAPDGAMVDHADGDGLNNRRGNLRLATDSQNQANRDTYVPGQSSRYRGVIWDRRKNAWAARIKVNSVTRRLGLHRDETAAALAYDAAAWAAWGEFARLNFPQAARGSA